MEIAELTWLDFILLAVACWRLCHLLAKDHGPWQVLDKFRDRFPLGGLTTCVYCLSWPWLSILLLVVHLYVTTWLTWSLAVAGAALMLRSYTGAGIHD